MFSRALSRVLTRQPFGFARRVSHPPRSPPPPPAAAASSSREKTREFRYAQDTLTEDVIRPFWKEFTSQYPRFCVQGGIAVDFDTRLNEEVAHFVAQQLSLCDSKIVAAPLFEYNFEPSNPLPHHLAALTVVHFSDRIVVGLFNPKGRDGERSELEFRLFTMVCQSLSQKHHKRVQFVRYEGMDLQQDDFIGLCQLYSLLYLYMFVTESAQHYRNHYNYQQEPSPTVAFPDLLVERIKEKHGSYDENLLHWFWSTQLRKMTASSSTSSSSSRKEGEQ